MPKHQVYPPMDQRVEGTPHPDFLLDAENLSLSHKGRGENGGTREAHMNTQNSTGTVADAQKDNWRELPLRVASNSYGLVLSNLSSGETCPTRKLPSPGDARRPCRSSTALAAFSVRIAPPEQSGLLHTAKPRWER